MAVGKFPLAPSPYAQTWGNTVTLPAATVAEPSPPRRLVLLSHEEPRAILWVVETSAQVRVNVRAGLGQTFIERTYLVTGRFAATVMAQSLTIDVLNEEILTSPTVTATSAPADQFVRESASVSRFTSLTVAGDNTIPARARQRVIVHAAALGVLVSLSGATPAESIVILVAGATVTFEGWAGILVVNVAGGGEARVLEEF